MSLFGSVLSATQPDLPMGALFKCFVTLNNIKKETIRRKKIRRKIKTTKYMNIKKINALIQTQG